MSSKNKSVEMEPEVKKSLEDFRKSVASTAEDIIFKKFPSKILQMQKLVAESAMPSSHFHISHAAKSTDTTVHHSLGDPSIDPRKPKKRKLEDHETADDAHFTVYPSYVTANRQLQVVLKHVKDECDELVSLCDTVTLWVNLSMPRIEDGDNFGVQIQEEVLSELSKSQEAAYNTRDGVRTHHLARAKICSKMIKYPHLEDYPLALAEHDEKQYYFARQHLIDIRNIYAVLTDILHKNIAKIRSPKGNNSVGLY